MREERVTPIQIASTTTTTTTTKREIATHVFCCSFSCCSCRAIRESNVVAATRRNISNSNSKQHERNITLLKGEKSFHL